MFLFEATFAYVLSSRLIEAKDVVFECGPKCGCGLSCINRTSQRGLKYRFEVVLSLPLCLVIWNINT